MASDRRNMTSAPDIVGLASLGTFIVVPSMRGQEQWTFQCMLSTATGHKSLIPGKFFDAAASPRLAHVLKGERQHLQFREGSHESVRVRLTLEEGKSRATVKAMANIAAATSEPIE